MTQEDKHLLLKDLCGRLPYGVKVRGNYSYSDGDKIVDDIQTKVLDIYDIDWVINNIEIKPYLFPLSSMTEEEKKEFIHCAEYEVEESVNGRHYEYYLKDYVGTPENPICNYDAIDWLNKNHFDYRGLISMGLAKDATGLNVY